jgi:hypothetical protein
MPQNPIQGLAAAIPQDKKDALRDYYHAGQTQRTREGMLDENNLPDVAPPSWFQPDPLVVGQPGMSRAAKSLMDLDPVTKSRVSSIIQGPTHASMREMVRSDLPPDMFAGTSLLGVTDLRSMPFQVGINPGMPNDETLDTLVHELGHVSGYGEKGAQGAQAVAGTLQPSSDVSVEALLNALKKAGISATAK